jgi:hypothetical protein
MAAALNSSFKDYYADKVDFFMKKIIKARADKSEELPIKNDTIVIVYNPKLESKAESFGRKIDDSLHLYNLKNVKNGDGYKLFSSIFSDINELIPVDSSVFTINNENSTDETDFKDHKFEQISDAEKIGIANLMLSRRERAARMLKLLPSKKLVRDENDVLEESINEKSAKSENLNEQVSFCEEFAATTSREADIQDVKPPVGCLYNCDKCSAKVNFTVASIESKIVVQSELVKELKEHGHKSSLVVDKKTGRQRTTDEARAELIAHIRFHH